MPAIYTRNPLVSLLFTPETSRYISLIISFITSLHLGTLYVFAAYASDLASHIDNTHISMISAIGHAGYLCNLFLGILYTYYGYYITSFISLCMLSIGYLVLTTTVDYNIYCICYFFIGLGSGGLQLSIVVRNCENFPISNRGFIMGLLFGGLAISGLFWISLYLYVVNSINSFFIIIGFSCLISGLFAVLFVDSVEPDRSPKGEYSPNTINEETYAPVNITGLNMLRSTPFWILLFLEFVTYGVSLAWKSEMGLALTDHTDAKIGMLYTLVAFNSCSRFFVGFLSDTFVNNISRPNWLLIALIFLFVGHFAFVVDPNMSALWAANIFIGIGYGASVCISNTLVSIIYGYENYGFNNGLLHLGGAAGALFFTKISDLLAHSTTCSTDSTQCYHLAFVVSACFLLIGIVITIVLIKQYPSPWLLPFKKEFINDSEYEPCIEESEGFKTG